MRFQSWTNLQKNIQGQIYWKIEIGNFEKYYNKDTKQISRV